MITKFQTHVVGTFTVVSFPCLNSCLTVISGAERVCKTVHFNQINHVKSVHNYGDLFSKQAVMSWDSNYGYIFNNHHYHYQGRAIKCHQLKKKMSRLQRERFFCSGVGQKSLWVGCSGVGIPSSEVENDVY